MDQKRQYPIENQEFQEIKRSACQMKWLLEAGSLNIFYIVLAEQSDLLLITLYRAMFGSRKQLLSQILLSLTGE